MEIRTIPNLRSMTDLELRKLAAAGGDFGAAAAYVVDLRREVAGLVKRVPMPACHARSGELLCDLPANHPTDVQHFDQVLERRFETPRERSRTGLNSPVVARGGQ